MIEVETGSKITYECLDCNQRFPRVQMVLFFNPETTGALRCFWCAFAFLSNTGNVGRGGKFGAKQDHSPSENETTDRTEKSRMIKDEHLASDFISGDAIPRKGHEDKITGTDFAKSDFDPGRENLVLTLEHGVNGANRVRVNKTSLKLLVAKWGREEKKFIGKKVFLSPMKGWGDKAAVHVEPV